MADLQIDIVTPQREVFSGTATEVRVPGWLGEFGVLPGHDVILSLLRAGVCTVIGNGVEQKFLIGRGFAEVGPESVRLLTDRAVLVSDLKKADEIAAYETAEKQLNEAEYESAEWRSAEERVEWGRAAASV